MYCYYCGNLLKEDELFCPKCGKEAKEIHINLDHLKFYEELITKKVDEIPEVKATPEVEFVPEAKVVPKVEVNNEISKENIKIDEINNEKQTDSAKNNTQNRSAKKVVVRIKPKKK